jgi:transglutaminase-like putative cysteine protease
VATPLSQVFMDRRGVCQDFAHLAIACLRTQGLPARYVSGYIETLPPPGQQKLLGSDASHAWFSVYDPDAGWLDFDPTNNQIPMNQHITTAWGRDYSDVTPLRGVIFGGGAHRAEVAVDVEPRP